ncbi:MAG: histidine phosphatase family protein [Chitinophagaceae bacterium]
MISLIIARHGETIENISGICQGQTDGTLSEKGLKENDELGKKLMQYDFQTIYSSPLGRALETAKAIQLNNQKSSIIIDERLMERHLGIFQGKPYPIPYYENELYEGMETVGSMAERMNSFLLDIKKNKSDETIVMVSHGYVLKVLLSIIENLPVNDFYKVTLMGNSGFVEKIV